jgi:hypothetical protein
MAGRLSRLRKLTIGKFRRQLLVSFRRRLVKKNLGARQGECLQCADCCKLLFRCPFLTKANLCSVYHSPMRSTVCAKFPFNQKDLDEVKLTSGRECGYSFPAEVEEPVNTE